MDRNTVILFHAGFLIFFAWNGFLVEYLVLWILPLVTVVQAILRLRAIAEHGATTDFSSPLTAARTNLGPAWLRWLIFPHNVNYHVEHHLYASVPQYHLPRLHQEMTRRGVLQMGAGLTLGGVWRTTLLCRTGMPYGSRPAASGGEVKSKPGSFGYPEPIVLSRAPPSLGFPSTL